MLVFSIAFHFILVCIYGLVPISVLQSITTV